MRTLTLPLTELAADDPDRQLHCQWCGCKDVDFTFALRGSSLGIYGTRLLGVHRACLDMYESIVAPLPHAPPPTLPRFPPRLLYRRQMAFGQIQVRHRREGLRSWPTWPRCLRPVTGSPRRRL